MRVLIVDNDSEMLEATARALREGFSIDVVTGKADALDLLRQNDFHVVVACERLNDGSGLDLLSQTAKRWPETIRLFAATADRLSLLRGRLGPFKLFQTLDYPINPGQLGSVLMLAQAAQAADVDTTTIQHIVMGDDRASEVDSPSQTFAAMPAQNLAGGRVSPRPLPFSVPTVNPPADVPAPRRKPVTRESLATTRPAAAPSRLAPSHPSSTGFAPPISSTQRSRILERMPAPAGQPRDAVTEEVPALSLTSMRLEPIPEGISAYRTQIMIGGAAALVLLAAGLGIYLSSGDAETPAAATAAAATSGPAEPSTASAADPIIAQIETALTRDDTGGAKGALDQLRRQYPAHPRLAFFDAIVSRREELEGASVRAARQTARAEERAAAAIAEAGEAAARLPEPSPPTSSGSAVLDTSAPAQQAAAEPPPATQTAASSPPPAPSSFTGRTLETTDAAGVSTAAAVPASTPAATAPPATPRRGSTDPENLPPVVREAKLVRRSPPDYPPDAVREGKQGSVDISFLVTAEGRVTEAVVVTSTDRVFERPALNAVKRWRYEPRMEDGRPVDWRTQVKIAFKLDE